MGKCWFVALAPAVYEIEEGLGAPGEVRGVKDEVAKIKVGYFKLLIKNKKNKKITWESKMNLH